MQEECLSELVNSSRPAQQALDLRFVGVESEYAELRSWWLFGEEGRKGRRGVIAKRLGHEGNKRIQ